MKNLKEQLKKEELKVISSREKWQKEIKPLLLKKLNSIKDYLDLNLFVQENDSIINHETVLLSFSDEPSGLSYNPNDIFNQQESKSGIIVKTGGYIVFSQIYNGEIIIWISYPRIDEVLKLESETIHLKIVSIDELTDDLIESSVEIFLKEMIKWQKHGVKYSKIGYQLRQ